MQATVVDGHDERHEFDTLKEAKRFVREERLREYCIYQRDDNGDLGDAIERCSGLGPQDFEQDAVEDSPCLPEPWWSYR